MRHGYSTSTHDHRYYMLAVLLVVILAFKTTYDSVTIKAVFVCDADAFVSRLFTNT